MYLIGQTTHGHHQIELACEACHTESFSDRDVLQAACVDCHGAELKAVEDSHPKKKFTDPRHAERVQLLDARYCITCHAEHQPDLTQPMGLTQPEDVCFLCHCDIREERPSHADLGFDTCGSAGCHNFHDNRALYEDFLVQHLNEPATKTQARVPRRNLAEMERLLTEKPLLPLTAAQQDAPADIRVDPRLLREWENTAHAQAGVNCLDCHGAKEPDAEQRFWRDRVDREACKECHEPQVAGFLSGKHGMRLAQELDPMRPDLAHKPMKEDAGDKELSCATCHKPHRFDTKKAAVEACLGCHDDAHSRAYKDSPHFKLWQWERAGLAASGTGVSCATCHLPRAIHKKQGLEAIQVQHNQNDNLRPNDKMLRSVCLNCHGLGISIDALADAQLVENNFSGLPSRHIQSLDWAERRLKLGLIKKDKDKNRDYKSVDCGKKLPTLTNWWR